MSDTCPSVISIGGVDVQCTMPAGHEVDDARNSHRGRVTTDAGGEVGVSWNLGRDAKLRLVPGARKRGEPVFRLD